GLAESAYKAHEALLRERASPYLCIPWLTPLSIPGVEAIWGQRFVAMYSRFADPVFPTPPEPVIQRPNFPSDAQLLKDYDGARLVLHEGERSWRDGHDVMTLPIDQWRDDWGPITRPQWDFNTANELLEQFFADQEFFNHINRSNPVAAEQELLKRGYRSVGQYFRVALTIAKHYGTPTDESLFCMVFDDADCQS